MAKAAKAATPATVTLKHLSAALATEQKIIITLNFRDFASAAALGVRVLSPSVARSELLP